MAMVMLCWWGWWWAKRCRDVWGLRDLVIVMQRGCLSHIHVCSHGRSHVFQLDLVVRCRLDRATHSNMAASPLSGPDSKACAVYPVWLPGDVQFLECRVDLPGAIYFLQFWRAQPLWPGWYSLSELQLQSFCRWFTYSISQPQHPIGA